MLSQITTNGSRIIIVDESENHLHPESIHYIDSVLQKISSTHQVLISTHNPIFVNRNSITSNLIVDSGRVVKARKIEEIRATLGVVCSDNLIDADYIIVVEGASDKAVFTKFFLEDVELKDFFDNKALVVQDIGGTHNLQRVAFLLQQLCCNFLFILDYDSAGNELKSALSIPEEKIRYLMKANRKDTELEDLYNPEIYRDLFYDRGLSIDDDIFKNCSLKWLDKVKSDFANIGFEFSKNLEDEFKEVLSEKVCDALTRDCFTAHGYDLISAIFEKVKKDIKYMKKICNMIANRYYCCFIIN